MSKKQKGQVQLEEHGFTDIEAKWGGRWFVAKDKEELVCFLRQGSGAWHAFYSYRATGSGGDPRRALTGGLGDVIDDNFALINYSHLVKNAPSELVHRFDGLYEAGVQVVN